MAHPDIAVVTEKRIESFDCGLGRTHFLVDRLDGTRKFADRSCDSTVNIKLIEDCAPVAGAIFAPAIGRLFSTVPGSGAVEERTDGTTRPLRAAEADDGALRVVVSRSHRDAATEAWLTRYAVADFRAAGSSLKFCLRAGGEAALYPRLSRTMEWDTAATDAVLRAAG